MMVQPVPVRTFDCGHRLHRVPAEIVGLRLAADISSLCDGDWWAMIALAGGQVVLRHRRHRSKADPGWGLRPLDEEKSAMLLALAVALNRDMHSGGHWIVAWTDEDELIALWRDRDGDLQFTVEVPDEGWERLRRRPVGDFVNIASQAFATWWQTLHQDLGLKPGQLAPLAQGARPERLN